MFKKKILLLLLLALYWLPSSPVAAQCNINTVAGTGKTYADGSPATIASLNFPVGVAVDSSGNVYIADYTNNLVRKIDTGGNLTTIAGNNTAGYSGDTGPATAAKLNGPSGVSLDASGNIYIADSNNSVIRKIDTGGTITTFAGNGSAGYSGDTGPATAASLNGPWGIGVDASSNVYIADSNNNVVRQVAAGTGTITTFAGNGSLGYSGDSGPATAATMYHPVGVAVDSSGNAYISDIGNTVIREVTAGTGTITTFAGTGVAAYSGDGGPATAAAVNNPWGVAVDSANNVYIIDTYNLVLRKVTAGSGTITTVAGNGAAGFSGDGGPATSATFQGPYGVAVDSSGNIYITDTFNQRIRKVNPGGTITTFAGDGLFYGGDSGAGTSASLNLPVDVTLDNSGNAYIADYFDKVVRKLDTAGNITTLAGNGTAGYSGDNGPATAASLRSPAGISADSAGNVYIADAQNNVVRKVDTLGTITTFAGNGGGAYSGDNGPATAASLNFPSGVAVDITGNVYVADSANNVIRMIDTGGTITTIAGTGALGYAGDNGPATAASLDSPGGVAVDTAGNVYIADFFNNVIRKVAAGSGTITTFAGNGTAGYSGDNGPATAAMLNTPNRVFLDLAGNLYIADTGNNAIREVTAGSGTITTFAGNGTAGYSGDTGPATAAMINSPYGLAVDASGRVYIADSNNNRVRKIVCPPPTPTATATPTITTTKTATGTATTTATVTLTLTPSTTASQTATKTQTATVTATASATNTTTPLPTSTYTLTPSQTGTATQTATPEPLDPLLTHVVTYPNPSKDGNLTFYFYSATGVDFGLIKIYTTSMRLVKTLEFDAPAGGPLTVIWDGKNISGSNLANGLYYYIVSIDRRLKHFKAIGKLVVLR